MNNRKLFLVDSRAQRDPARMTEAELKADQREAYLRVYSQAIRDAQSALRRASEVRPNGDYLKACQELSAAAAFADQAYMAADSLRWQ